MNILKTKDPVEFYETHFKSWLKREASDGVLLRNLKRPKDNQQFYAASDLTACLTPGDQIILSNGSKESAASLATHLANQETEVPGLFGPAPLSTAFADTYSLLRGLDYTCVKRLGHYELSKLQTVAEPAAKFRRAKSSDLETLIEFRRLSQLEENTQRPSDPRTAVQNEFDSSFLFVLEDQNEAIVCTGTMVLGRSPRSGYISGIYTPIENRRSGLASYMTHCLCKELLKMDLIPSLSVDVENAPAIRAYEKVGFVQKCIMENIRFR